MMLVQEFLLLVTYSEALLDNEFYQV
jgi:hypothetical protein